MLETKISSVEQKRLRKKEILGLGVGWGRCQEHLIESKRKELAVFNLEQGRSQRASGFPVTKYLEDCSDAGGIDLFPGVLEESTATMGLADTGRRFSTRQRRETKKFGGGHILGDAGSCFPNQGSNLRLLPWEHGILTTGEVPPKRNF